MSNYEKHLLNCLQDIQVFLATSECLPYLDSIKREEQLATLNTLLQLENNIKENKNNA